MERTAYQTRAWRELPRTDCIVELLLGEAAGACHGVIHRHHVDPRNPDSRTVPVCASHHPKVHSILHTLRNAGERRTCTHRHPYPGGREECERRMNAA